MPLPIGSLPVVVNDPGIDVRFLPGVTGNGAYSTPYLGTEDVSLYEDNKVYHFPGDNFYLGADSFNFSRNGATFYGDGRNTVLLAGHAGGDEDIGGGLTRVHSVVRIAYEGEGIIENPKVRGFMLSGAPSLGGGPCEKGLYGESLQDGDIRDIYVKDVVESCFEFRFMNYTKFTNCYASERVIGSWEQQPKYGWKLFKRLISGSLFNGFSTVAQFHNCVVTGMLKDGWYVPGAKNCTWYGGGSGDNGRHGRHFLLESSENVIENVNDEDNAIEETGHGIYLAPGSYGQILIGCLATVHNTNDLRIESDHNIIIGGAYSSINLAIFDEGGENEHIPYGNKLIKPRYGYPSGSFTDNGDTTTGEVINHATGLIEVIA